METIGERIKRARGVAGLSQQALAQRADVSMNGIARLEQDSIKDPHVSQLRKIAEALGVSVGELVGEPVPLASAPSASPSPDGEPGETGHFDEAPEEEERRIQAFLSACPSEEERTARIEHAARLVANYAEDWLSEIRDMETTKRLTYGKHIVFGVFQDQLNESLRASGLLDYAERVEERKVAASQRDWEAADALLDGLLKLHNLVVRAGDAENKNHRDAGVKGTYEPKRTMRHFGDAVRPVGPELKVLQGGKAGQIKSA